MENGQINREASAAEAAAELLRLSPGCLELALVQYALELTILARAYFLEEKVESARDCNETLHRLLGFVGQRLRGKGAEQLIPMIETLAASAAQKGWLQILRASAKQAMANE
jgi:hypothetical protein